MAKILVVQEIRKNSVRLHDALPEHEILDFDRATEAMNYLRSSAVDMIISAVHLDESNVFDFLQWVKGDPNHRDVPFVFFCAEPTEVARYVSAAIISAARVLGATKYITMKEFDRDALRKQVNSILDQFLEVPGGALSYKELQRRESELRQREHKLNEQQSALDDREIRSGERERFLERRERSSSDEKGRAE